MILKLQVDDVERREALILVLTQEGHRVWIEESGDGLASISTTIVFAEINPISEEDEHREPPPQTENRVRLQAISKRQSGILLESKGHLHPNGI